MFCRCCFWDIAGLTLKHWTNRNVDFHGLWIRIHPLGTINASTRFYAYPVVVEILDVYTKTRWINGNKRSASLLENQSLCHQALIVPISYVTKCIMLCLCAYGYTYISSQTHPKPHRMNSYDLNNTPGAEWGKRALNADLWNPLLGLKHHLNATDVWSKKILCIDLSAK